MPAVVSVKFKYVAHDLWFDPVESQAQEGDHVICETERGQEIGLVTHDPAEVSPDHLREVIGEAGVLRSVVRVASEDDLDRADRLATRADEAFPTFQRLAYESGLDMKPVGVEYPFGGGKIVCYFSAEDRVDFRQLVRDLSHELHERVDMRQIGVREEAAIVGGFGHCGQELCCTRFGRRFEPVSIRMAKEQDLPLNSAKISGACGRLMCCLRYEFEAYRDFKGRAPKRNAVIDTPLGKARIVEYDTPKEQIALRLENGKQVRIPLADMEASPAAHKKSEELGCACRPDTVTREALERLQSPDVQMALAELDRKMGVIPQEVPASEDIFVDTRTSRRRRATVEEKGAGVGTAGGPRPQRERRSAREVRVTQTEETEVHVRRRRKTAQAGAQDGQDAHKAAGPAADATANKRRRRRHHAAAEGGSTAGAPEKHAASSGSRRRRPGDRGGQASGGQGRASGTQAPAAGGQGKQGTRKESGTRNAAAQTGAGQAPEATRRRRHHRGGRGKNGGGQNKTGTGGQGASSSSE